MNKSAKEVRNAYHRKWRAEHKAKVSEYNSRYWERKAAANSDFSADKCNNTKK